MNKKYRGIIEVIKAPEFQAFAFMLLSIVCGIMAFFSSSVWFLLCVIFFFLSCFEQDKYRHK